MLASYIHEVAKIDQEVAHVMRKRPTVKPTGKPGDVNKMKLGQIDSSNLTVMFTRAEGERFFSLLLLNTCSLQPAWSIFLRLFTSVSRTGSHTRKFLRTCFGGISLFVKLC